MRFSLTNFPAFAKFPRGETSNSVIEDVTVLVGQPRVLFIDENYVGGNVQSRTCRDLLERCFENSLYYTSFHRSWCSFSSVWHCYFVAQLCSLTRGVRSTWNPSTRLRLFFARRWRWIRCNMCDSVQCEVIGLETFSTIFWETLRLSVITPSWNCGLISKASSSSTSNEFCIRGSLIAHFRR